MDRPARPELDNLKELVMGMRHRAIRDRNGEAFYVWSFQYIDDLRPREQRS
jgi:hypothetical protein